MGELTQAYTTLFNAITDTIGCLEACNYGQARAILICAQQVAEEKFLQQAEQKERD